MKINSPSGIPVIDDSPEILGTDLTSWEIGPYHGSLPGQMKLKLKLDGEVFVAGETELGFLHRGLEKTFELHYWQSATAYADHLDPEAGAFGELALCLAVEAIGGIQVPPRAQCIRIIVSELTRISSHFAFIARMARAVGSNTMFHYVLRDREKVLDLLELLAGARFSLNFLRFGGVNADVTEGFIERVLELSELMRVRLKEYNDLFSYNHAFLKRSSRIATISAEQVARFGITGPNARASGVSSDVRKVHPYSAYGLYDFEIPIVPSQDKNCGDAHSRFMLRLREITQSIEILKQTAEAMPSGDFELFKVGKDFTVPEGEAYARVESQRGLLGCHVVSNGTNKPARVQFRVPSIPHVQILPELILGSRIEDLPMILASMDISIAEVDR